MDEHMLTELGERLAEEGPHRHAGALRRLAAAVATRLPGTAAVLTDTSAPAVLRERAFSVAADAVVRSATWPDEPRARTRAAQTEEELQRLLLDWRGQLAGWGA